jgi:hypothetical protein
VNQRDLVEAAAIIARYADLIGHSDHPLETESVEEYWVASRRRWRSWTHRQITSESFADSVQLAEEIMVAEMATRVWTGVYYIHILHHPNPDGLRMVRQALKWHVDARQSVLQDMIDTYNRTELNGLLRLDRVRRRVERWTDFLIGTMSKHGVALNLAFDPDRCRNNSASLQDTPTADAVWPLTIAGLTRSFPTSPRFSDEAARFHSAVLKSQLMAFPSGAFRNDGRPLSAPLNRVVQKLFDRVPIAPEGD